MWPTLRAARSAGRSAYAGCVCRPAAGAGAGAGAGQLHHAAPASGHSAALYSTASGGDGGGGGAAVIRPLAHIKNPHAHAHAHAHVQHPHTWSSAGKAPQVQAPPRPHLDLAPHHAGIHTTAPALKGKPKGPRVLSGWGEGEAHPQDGELYFCALGGCGSIGMNMYMYYYNGKWLAVDLGLKFPDFWMRPTIEFVCPDISFLEEPGNKENIAGT